MTARHLRESPRMIAAGVISAVVVVLIGVLIGSATASGGTSSDPAATALRERDASQAAQLQSARQTIAGLRVQQAAVIQRLGSVRSQLTSARARVRCWRTTALHHAAGRVPKCAART